MPDALLARDLGQFLRGMLLRSGLTRVYHCGLVFASAVSAVVFAVEKGKAPKKIISQVREGMSAIDEHRCSRRRFQSDPRHRLLVHASDKEAHLLQRITTNSHPLGSIVHISRGEEIGRKHVHSEGAVPITVGDDITRYALKRPTRFIDKITKHDELYESPKIVVVKTGWQCIAAIDCDDRVTMQSVYNLHGSDDSIALEGILGILNSRFVRFFIYKTFTAYKLLFPQLNQTTIESIPIPRRDARRWKPLCKRVTTRIALHTQLAAAKTAHEKTALQRQIDATDRQIDQLVYDLYGLTDDEIRIVEDATQ